MNISAINHTYNSNRNNTQAFKGLWGKTSVINDQEPAMCVFKNQETCYYYPFEDESNEEIRKVVERNSYANIDVIRKQYKVRECKICTTLPFTKNAYQQYENAGLTTEVTDDLTNIHMSVKDKFTNNKLNQQTSAVNEEFRKNLYLNA